MRLALRELRRRPSRFAAAVGILALLATLLMLLGGLLDGLTNTAVNALRAQRADLLVFSADSRVTLTNSRIDTAARADVAGVTGVDRVGGLSVTQLGARLPGKGPRDLVAVALFGYEIDPTGVPDPPAAGEVYADDTLRNQGISRGDTILVGPQRSPLRVVGFVSGTNYNFGISLWASVTTWSEITTANRPDASAAPGVSQVLVVQSRRPPEQLARAIDDATAGRTTTYTIDGSIAANEGVQQQSGTFNQIIGVTIFVAVVVVALFFALLVIERTALYGVLKAVGARSSTLFGGIVLQAVIVTLVASAIGAAVAALLAIVLPPDVIPYQLSTTRVVSSVALLLAAAVIGCAFTLRRVLRIDPASAIGTAA